MYEQNSLQEVVDLVRYIETRGKMEEDALKDMPDVGSGMQNVARSPPREKNTYVPMSQQGGFTIRWPTPSST